MKVMGKILLMVGIVILYAILTGVMYALFKKLGIKEPGVAEALAPFFPLSIPCIILFAIACKAYDVTARIIKVP